DARAGSLCESNEQMAQCVVLYHQSLAAAWPGLTPDPLQRPAATGISPFLGGAVPRRQSGSRGSRRPIFSTDRYRKRGNPPPSSTFDPYGCQLFNRGQPPNCPAAWPIAG